VVRIQAQIHDQLHVPVFDPGIVAEMGLAHALVELLSVPELELVYVLVELLLELVAVGVEPDMQAPRMDFVALGVVAVGEDFVVIEADFLKVG
jgi:hypothetical protein